ncbi:MAG: succinate dehydrogenase, partial [Bacteroidota bacterium]
MKWLIDLLTSSIGRKLLMSLTGLFLISFLAVHLLGNFQLLVDDQGASFNAYAKFMTGNPIIKTISYGLYAFILLHIVQGFALWAKNSSAREVNYAVKVNRGTQSNAKIASSMGWLGAIIAVFIGLHMYQFWYKMHWELEPGTNGIKDLYGVVAATYEDPIYVGIYVVS